MKDHDMWMLLIAFGIWFQGCQIESTIRIKLDDIKECLQQDKEARDASTQP